MFTSLSNIQGQHMLILLEGIGPKVVTGPRYSEVSSIILLVIGMRTIWATYRFLAAIARRASGMKRIPFSRPNTFDLAFQVLGGLFATLVEVRIVLHEIKQKGLSDPAAIAGSISQAIEPLLIAIFAATICYGLVLVTSKLSTTARSGESNG
jgi:hypothetical protein